MLRVKVILGALPTHDSPEELDLVILLVDHPPYRFILLFELMVGFLKNFRLPATPDVIHMRDHGYLATQAKEDTCGQRTRDETDTGQRRAELLRRRSLRRIPGAVERLDELPCLLPLLLSGSSLGSSM